MSVDFLIALDVQGRRAHLTNPGTLGRRARCAMCHVVQHAHRAQPAQHLLQLRH